MTNPATQSEPILEPDLPIIDPHHHLWDWPAAMFANRPATHGFEKVIRRATRYLLPEFLADLNSGHNIRATVFVQCGAMYRADAAEAFKPIGETEFVNGVAAMCASGIYGEVRACAGIVGHVDLGADAALVSKVLEGHLNAGGERFRGIRHSASYDADSNVLGPLVRVGGGLYASKTFREGYARLAEFDLSFDAWLLEPQLPELIDLARAFPQIPVILDHVGTPLGVASYQGKREQRFPIWRDNIAKLAALPNVSLKLGGLAMAFCNFQSFLQSPPASSVQLAAEWKPYIDTCIELFGVQRCMFESNFPVDLGSCTYPVLWNAFKLLAKNCSADEKAALFSGTAKRVYRLKI
jgi:L-fuconolactonase